MNDFPKPAWRPSIFPTIEWSTRHLQMYLSGKRFSVFLHGSCVVWPEQRLLEHSDCIEILRSVVVQHPDFKVRRHSDGNFLVTFRGGVGGVMSGEILLGNLEKFRDEAYSMGRLRSEVLKEETSKRDDDLDLIAGLYVRSRLYMDVESPRIFGSY